MRSIKLQNKILLNALAIMLAVLICGPILSNGFVLTGDMVFTPTPQEYANSNSFITNLLLAKMGAVIGFTITEKVLLIFTVAAMFMGLYKLHCIHNDKPKLRVLICIFYVMNPFVYERLMTGQYRVLAGYALLPWFLASLIAFARQPGWKPVAKLTAWALALSVVSIHAAGIAVVASVPVVALALWRNRSDRLQLRRFAGYGAAIVMALLLLSSYWLVPTIMGSNPAGQAIQGFGQGDRAAYQTTGDTAFERIGNVLGLQGFWAERYDLFIMPQQVVPAWLWTVAVLSLLALVAYGAVRAWRDGNRSLVVIAGWMVVVGAVLAAGIGNAWMADHVPFFAGYREPQKFAMLIALGYALLLAPALQSLVVRLSSLSPFKPRPRFAMAVVAVLFIGLTLTLTPSMLWGGAGQLKAVQYPAGWQSVDQLIPREKGVRVVALPWHLYLKMDFVGRVVANPVPKYYGYDGRTVISSADPEFGGSSVTSGSAGTAEVDAAVDAALANPDTVAAGRDFAQTMRQQDVHYVILTKNTDFQRYGFVDDLPGWQRVYDDEDIALYRYYR